MSDSPLARALQRYRAHAPEQHDTIEMFEQFLASSPAVFGRAHTAGHFTGSALVLSADGRRTLLTHHAKLNLWLQPGGHADGDADLAQVALREAQEETGVAGLHLVDGEIFDLDRHAIPARAAEPGHWHYDVRFLVRAGADERFVRSDESHALAWRDLAQLADDAHADASLRRMARKWLARGRTPAPPSLPEGRG